jgi:Carbohydrate-binding family 9
MKFFFLLISLPCLIVACNANKEYTNKLPIYKVQRLLQPIKIDADWNKAEWQHAAVINIKHFIDKIPLFHPGVQAKMLYDSNNIYIIFRVNDKYVRCFNNKINGPVWDDSAVEIFFSPDEKFPNKYFNLEINSGGTALMHYQIIPRIEFKIVDTTDIKQIEIAHSLPEIVNPEIKEPVVWTLEYRLPISILKKYSNITQPKAGNTWKANFFKTSNESSNPHWMTWTFFETEVLDFHLPQFFGVLEFQ